MLQMMNTVRWTRFYIMPPSTKFPYRDITVEQVNWDGRLSSTNCGRTPTITSTEVDATRALGEPSISSAVYNDSAMVTADVEAAENATYSDCSRYGPGPHLTSSSGKKNDRPPASDADIEYPDIELMVAVRPSELERIVPNGKPDGVRVLDCVLV